MKKLIVLFSVIAFAVCPFTPSTGNDRIPSSDGVEEIIFHISGEAGDIYRTPDIAPFSCFAFYQMNMLMFYSGMISSVATVIIEDLNTGEQQESEIVIGSTPSTVYFPASGNISIIVILQNGLYYSALISL